jgi:hypothetical protein
MVFGLKPAGFLRLIFDPQAEAYGNSFSKPMAISRLKH